MARYEIEEIKGIPYGRQKTMATWSKRTAQKVAKKLKPLVSKRVVLYGGGGFDANIGKLKSVKVKKKFYYKNGKPPRSAKLVREPNVKSSSLGWFSKTDYKVVADLVFSKDQAPFGKTGFSPNIGSWKIGKLKKVM